jgi:transketolase
MTTATLARPERLMRALHRLTGDEKHSPSAYSTLDVLWVLYDRVLDVSPDRLDDPARDRFLLSKGHGPQAYYAVLAAKGFVPESWLAGWGGAGSRLGYHPDRTLVPGVEIGSGSLGHGLPLAVGTALGLRAQGLTASRVVVLLGDAELDEGSNHEAIPYAAAAGLGSLTAVVVDNASATHGWPGGIASRFTVNGWTADTVDGRDHQALATALSHRGERPHVVVATVESKWS